MAASRAVMSLLILVLLLLCVNIINVDEDKKKADVLKDLLKKKGVSILHQNVRGLLYNKPAIEELTFSNKDIDVLTLSETHISTDEDNDNLYHISGYHFEKRNRQNGKGGGVAMYVKDSINYIRRTDLESETLENIVIEIILSTSKDFLIASYYKPPQSSKYLQKNYNELFNESLTRLSLSKEVILLGDLNVDFLKASDNREFKSVLKENGFTQIIKDATRVTKESRTLIDIIATNRPETISTSAVIPSSISDHDLIACKRKLNHQKFASKTIKCRNYKSYDHNAMNEEFQQVNWYPVLTAPDVNIAVDIFNTIVKDIFDKHAPIIEKRIKGRPCPWMDDELKSIMNRRDQLLRKVRKTNSDDDWKNYKSLRNRCNNLTKKAKGAYHRNVINENRLNPKNFWNSIKEIFPTKTGTRNSTTINLKSNKRLAENFADYYASAVCKLKSIKFKLKNFVWNCPRKVSLRTNKTFEFGYVSKVFIGNYLKKIKRNKSTGLDDLPPGMLKDCREYIITPLHHIINLSLQSKIVPSAWKQAKIVPIFKSGDKEKAENYRPISVLPVLSKLLEKAVHDQLLTFLESNKLLNDSQFGYREKRSTQLATTLFVDEIRQAAENGKMVGALFLDLSKAFDTISHDVILTKLCNYGVASAETQWFTDYLFNRNQKVQIGSQYSSSFSLTCGVPQGSILGPLLFLVFFNDFQEHLTETHCIQYADDTVIYAAHENVNTIEDILNSESKNILTYCRNNELILNLKKGKTETVLFGTAKRLSKQTKQSLTVTIDGSPVHNVNSYTYLGNHLDVNLNLNCNFEKAYKKATGRLNLLSKLRCYINVQAAYKIYEMVIVPILMYSTMISLQLTATQLKKLNSFDNRANKIIGGDVKLRKLESRMKMQACNVVKKCLDGKLCEQFENYFEINEHSKRTRNRNKLLKLPKIKLEFGRKSFRFQGAKIFNNLPLEIRGNQNATEFRRGLTAHFNK